MSIDYEGNFSFAELDERLKAALPDAILAGGDYIGDKADERVPVLVDLERANQKRRADPGELKRSRYVRLSGNDAEIGYRAYWAHWQHERLDYKHEIGESKWLERTLVEDGHRALEKVTEYLREEL